MCTGSSERTNTCIFKCLFSTQTCLETRFKYVRWDGDSPVKDPGHPSSKQYAGNAELIVAA